MVSTTSRKTTYQASLSRRKFKQRKKISLEQRSLGDTHAFQQPFHRPSLVASKLLQAHLRDCGVALVPCWFQLRKNSWVGNRGQGSSKASSWSPRLFQIPGHSPRWTSLRESENAPRKRLFVKSLCVENQKWMSWHHVMNFLLYFSFAANFEYLSVLDPVMSSWHALCRFNSQLVSLREVLLYLLVYSEISYPGSWLGLFYANEVSRLYRSDWLV